MATEERTGVQIKADNVSITMVEAEGPSSSHSNRRSQKESAPQKGACHKSRVEWMMIFIELVVCVLFLGGIIANLISQGSKNREIWGLELWKWCVLALVIVGGRRLMKLMESFVVFLIRKIFFLLKCEVRYSYYIHRLGKYVRVFLWFGLVLLTCYLLFKSSKVKRSKLDSNVQKYIMRSLATCVIGGFLWVLKTLIVNILTPPFQATRLFDRFRESLIDQYILEVFSACSLKDSVAKLKRVVNTNWIKQNNLPTHDCMTNESVKMINWLKKIDGEQICAWPMKELIELIRSPWLSSITKELEKLAKNEKDVTKIFKETEGVAIQIFGSKDTKNIVVLELRWLFNEEADNVVQHINGVEEVAGEEEKKIGSQALRKWLVKAIIERRSLAQSLEDSERAKEELNKIVSGTVLILVFIIWLILLEILTTGALVVLVTQFAALAFIFGDTLKSVFQGIIFVSVMHPFDIGDCCLINGEEMVVERINLLSTVFRENLKDKIVYPNSVLTSLRVKNLHKGNLHVIEDSFEISIDSSTPADRLDYLKGEIERYLRKENHKEKWLPEFDFKLKEIENRKLKIVLIVRYRKTYLPSMINSMRDILIRKLKKILGNENKINGQKNEEKGKNKDDGQEKEEKGKNKVDDGQAKDGKDKNKDDGRKTAKGKIKYYNILPKVVDAE